MWCLTDRRRPRRRPQSYSSALQGAPRQAAPRRSATLLYRSLASSRLLFANRSGAGPERFATSLVVLDVAVLQSLVAGGRALATASGNRHIDLVVVARFCVVDDMDRERAGSAARPGECRRVVGRAGGKTVYRPLDVASVVMIQPVEVPIGSASACATGVEPESPLPTGTRLDLATAGHLPVAGGACARLTASATAHVANSADVIVAAGRSVASVHAACGWIAGVSRAGVTVLAADWRVHAACGWTARI